MGILLSRTVDGVRDNSSQAVGPRLLASCNRTACWEDGGWSSSEISTMLRNHSGLFVDHESLHGCSSRHCYQHYGEIGSNNPICGFNVASGVDR